MALTFNQMRKTLVSNQPELYNTQLLLRQSLFNRIRNKPFWIWNKEQHKQADIDNNGDCCFNHIIGLPKKDDVEKPIFDYEQRLHDLLEIDKKKYIWIKKSTGLGVTEFFLRYIAWICTRDNAMKDKRICIVTGPRIDLAVTLVDRLKNLFSNAGVFFNTKETVLELNGCIIEAFPSHHLDAMRGLTDVKMILLDEADFFPPSQQQQNARDVSERYIGKSDPYIVMVSTPNLPGGLFEKIELEDERTCIYHRIFLDYTVGLGKVYTHKEIEEAKASPSFDREYNLAYGYGLGNVVLPSEIDRATALGKAMESISPDNIHTYKTLGIDAGFGNSKFAFVISEAVDGKARVIHSVEYERPRQEVMLDIAYDLIMRYNIDKVYVDAANVSFIKSLKQWFLDSEVVDYERDPFVHSRRIVPVAFGSGNGTKMVSHLKDIFSKGLIAIYPQQHEQLIAQLRIAKVLENGNLDKTDSNSTFDLFDAFRLSLIRYTEDRVEVIRRK